MTADILTRTIPTLSDLLGKGQKRPQRSRPRPTLPEDRFEDWGLKASDALREEILSSSIPVSDIELSRIFSDYERKDNSLFESVETETIPLLREAVEAPIVQPELRESDKTIVSAGVTGATLVQEKSLGIFSDSRIYSSMLKHELKHYNVAIEHFHHPDSFQPEQFDLFDSIDAWMIFLSDTHESDFLERFLDRYDDKPTLFLSEKIQRLRTSRNIDRFLTENGLTNG